MRFLLIFLFLLISFQPSFGKITAQELSKTISQKIQQKPLGLPNPFFKWTILDEDFLKPSLSMIQNPTAWEQISWEEFLLLNKNAQQKELCSNELEIRYMEKQSQCPIALPMKDFYLIRSGYPDYEKILRNEKLIYIAEEMNHDTKAAPQEVVKILKAVRKINPNAKILLAAEFAVWYYPIQEILYFDNALQKDEQSFTFCLRFSKATIEEKKAAGFTEDQIKKLQEDCKPFLDFLKQREELERYASAPLLKEAGQKSYFLEYKHYSSVSKTADEQKIDLLALDDHVIEETENEDILIKVGRYMVKVPKNVSIPELGEGRASSLANFIKISSWGVAERTADWANRIKAVMDNYDIVLVYAGSGHLCYTYFTDLQPMVGKNPFVDIILYPMENLSKEKADFYEKRQELAEQNCLRQDCKIQKEWEKSLEGQSSFHQIDPFEEKNPPFWIEEDTEKIESFVKQHEEELKEWGEAAEKCSRDFIPTNIIQVFLPAQ